VNEPFRDVHGFVNDRQNERGRGEAPSFGFADTSPKEVEEDSLGQNCLFLFFKKEIRPCSFLALLHERCVLDVGDCFEGGVAVEAAEAADGEVGLGEAAVVVEEGGV